MYQDIIDVHCPPGTLGVTLSQICGTEVRKTTITKINRGSVLRRLVKVDDVVLALDGVDVTKPANNELVSKMVAAKSQNPVRILRVGRRKRQGALSNSGSVAAGSKRASLDSSHSRNGDSSSSPPVTVDLTDEVDKLREENRRLQEQLRLALASSSSPVVVNNNDSPKRRRRTP
uniref:PDZ domain-containing protein n=1 Tax=Leptocylindrus danicus TaxID=163516 RepID=A0A7S2JSQ6_9STRA|mmetsp:Transcript_10794/g.16234  ORF Transcript_10794/g.16234 Transcript_10794/m.16234 type:complete len:174 (+) Transcript_10794:208-729(+)